MCENISSQLRMKRDTLYTMERNMDMKYEWPKFNHVDDFGSLIRKVKGKGWLTIANTPQEFKKHSENFISDFLLGAYDSTDST
jgi:hypothetical protein